MAGLMSSYFGQLPFRQAPNNDFMTNNTTHQAFHANKDSEWSQLRDNVLGDYLADDDVFGLAYQHERSSSDDSAGGVFAYSMSSGQSIPTTGTSPDPHWAEQVAVAAAVLDNPMGIPPSMLSAVEDCVIIDTPLASPTRLQRFENPTSVQAGKPQSFWDKTVSKLEKGAKIVERLKGAKSHPDFLSLGGHPSPATSARPIIQVPVVPTPNQILSVPRSRGRDTASSRKRSTSQVRSASRGRPQGVAKAPATAGAINSGNATARKASLSPSKMMNPSRYRAGFEEAVMDNLSSSPTRSGRLLSHHQSLPPPPPPPPVHMQQPLYERPQQQRSSFPASPPGSGHLSHQDFTAFGTALPMHAHAHAVPDTQSGDFSPLAKHMGQAHLQTPPYVSPFFGQTTAPQNSYFDPGFALQSQYTTQQLPLTDTAVNLDPRTVSNTGRVESFDFGFAAGLDVLPIAFTSGYEQASMPAVHSVNVRPHDMYVHQPTLQALEANGMPDGLGISCDQTLFCPPTMAPHEYNALNNAYQTLHHLQPAPKACYGPIPHQMQPTTPQKHRSTALPPETPSPPNSDSRARRASGGSRIRRVSKHRRTKSATCLPKAVQREGAGFVNFTPDDSGKILSGVAPSGSSKTKARREKEAADKRRRLSQAAIKAVLDAGGDAEDLVKAGFDV